MFKSIKLYNDCDVYRNQNNIQPYGFNKNMTFGEIIDKAIEYKCFIIIKNGKGKWYLKGIDKDYMISKQKIEENVGKYPRRKCWLVEFL